MENALDPRKAAAEDDGPVVIGTYTDPIVGSLARAALQQAGIKCFLFDENTYYTRGGGLGGMNILGGMRLVVSPEDAENAKALLSQSGEGKGAPLR